MHHYMPEIYWHDKQGLLSVDVQPPPIENDGSQQKKTNSYGPYKLATASISIEKEIRIWEFRFDKEKDKEKEFLSLSVDFLANISGHNSTINIVRFSPDGKKLASGDSDGLVLIWSYDGRKEEQNIPPIDEDDVPPNKEVWNKFLRTSIRHESDVTGLCWNPTSTQVVSISNDDSICMNDVITGKRIWGLKNFRHYPNGVAWDPLGKYIVTLSTDRRLDILDAAKGTRLRSCSSINFPPTQIGNNYKLFIDDQFVSFVRTADFSPCGELLFAPSAHLVAAHKNIYGTYVFARADFDKCRPTAFLPCNKATKMVKCSPILYKLKDTKENYLGLPYRVIFAVLTKESVSIYDSQHQQPFAYIDSLQYEDLTCAAWAPDGKVLVISSLEGFNTFITLDSIEMSEVIDRPIRDVESPKLVAPRKPKKVVEKIAEKEAPNNSKVVTPASNKKDKDAQPQSKTPNRTSTNVSLLKYFTPKSEKQLSAEEKSEANDLTSISNVETSDKEKKSKKRVQLIQLD